MARKLQAGQRAELWIENAGTARAALSYSSSTMLFEAPNWSPDGTWLVFNGDGKLFRLAVDAEGVAVAEPEEIHLGGLDEINNDHVISPDGGTVYVSCADGHIYAVSLGPGAAEPPRRVTNDRGTGFRHYLHGVSPDGTTLAYIGVDSSGGEGAGAGNVFTVPAAGGPDTQLTDDAFPDDGAEFSPDGKWLYFNSERGSTQAGHAQLFRMAAPGSAAAGTSLAPEQLTFDDRVNWFPHPSPDGGKLAYVSFPPGTVGHPGDVDVVVRVLHQDGSIRDVAHVVGGQGTMNVPSWDPTGRRIAFMAYPSKTAPTQQAGD